MMMRCSKCGEEKSLSEFHKEKQGAGGLRSQCKKCRSDYSKKYRLTDKGKQARDRASKKYRQRHRSEIAKDKRDHRKTFIGRLRSCFQDINKRCNNPKDKAYKYYGGRGIQNRFESTNEFIDYVINILKVDPRGFTIDRIDNDGHYEKGNIRFVTHKENCNNRRKRT